MDIIMGCLMGIGISIIVFTCFSFAYMLGKKQAEGKNTENKLTEKEILEHKRKMEGMQNILSYDIQKAMGVKHE